MVVGIVGAGVAALLVRSGSSHEKPTLVFIAEQYESTNQPCLLTFREPDEADAPPWADLVWGKALMRQAKAGKRTKEFASMLVAHMVISNGQSRAVAVQSYGSRPQYRWTVFAPEELMGSDYGYNTGGGHVLRAGESCRFEVRLPPNTETWQLSIQCWQVSYTRAFLIRHPRFWQWWPDGVWRLAERARILQPDSRSYEILSPKLLIQK